MKNLLGIILLLYTSISFSQITYIDFAKIYDQAFAVVIEEDSANLKGQYKTIFTNEFRKIFLSEVSKKYFYKAYDNKLLKSYLESENFGATFAALLRIEGAKKLNPTLQRQQTIYSRNALNYATPNQCSSIIQNKPINKANGGLSGIELYALLPLKDYKNYFETTIKLSLGTLKSLKTQFSYQNEATENKFKDISEKAQENLSEIEKYHNYYANNVLVHNRTCFVKGTLIEMLWIHL